MCLIIYYSLLFIYFMVKFKKMILPAFVEYVSVRFEKVNRRLIPGSVRNRIDKGWVDDSFLVNAFLSVYMGRNKAVPQEVVKFGKIQIFCRGKNIALDERLEERKQYYCWKVCCKQGGSDLELILLLGDLTEEMDKFYEKKRSK